MKYSKNKSSSTNLPAGGVATSTGMDYQLRVAAWFAIHVLAEKDVTIPWGLPSNLTLESIRLETEYPIDDILVETSNSGRIFIQVKHSLGLEQRTDSDLASAIKQVVRQFISKKTGISNLGSERIFHPDRDRLLIITSPTSSTSISKTTCSLLGHIRDQGFDLKVPQREQQSLSVLSNHVRRSWNDLVGVEPTKDEILQLLSQVYIYVLDVDRDGKDELFCKNILRQAILKQAEDVDTAWVTLLSKFADLARARGGLDRNGLQNILQDAGIDLKVTNSFREDVERLIEYTSFTFDSVYSLSRILVGSEEVKVDRVYASKIQSAAETSHLLVVGEPGAGKSGALHDFVEILRQQEEDIVSIAVDRLSSYNLAEEIGLGNPFYKVLLNWPGVRPGFLVIDALDGARNEQTAQQIRNIIERVIKNNPRWHVVASVRKFDLRHNIDLKNLFRGNPIADQFDEEFKDVQHINIRDFNEHELDQIRSQSPVLSPLLDYKDPSLVGILKKPFNLRLIGELIGEGVSVDVLSPIRTQVELLSKYWLYRVIRNDSNGDARELVLRRIAEEMLKDHSMRIDRSLVITDVNMSRFIGELLSSHVLIEWQSSPKSKADRYVLAFSHNMLFDYAISRVIFGGNNTRLVKKLEEDHELVLAIRPSIVYHFHDLWFRDIIHERFWDAVSELMATNRIPLIGKLIGPSVAVELAQNSSDYHFVYSKLESDDPLENQLAQKIIKDTTGALLTSYPERNHFNDRLSLLWTEFTEHISRSMSQPVAYSVRAVLMLLCEQPKLLSFEHKVNLGYAARRLLEFAWSREGEFRDQGLIIHALKAVCRNYESDPIASRTLIQLSLKPDHLNRYGFEEMPRLADEIEWLIINDPGLSEDIYRKVFTRKETSEETTSMGGRILGFLSTRRQDFHLAQWRLAEVFQFFLETSPVEATRALVDIIQYYVGEKHPVKERSISTFTVGQDEVTIVNDYSAIWDSGSVHDGDEPVKMLNIFTIYLQSVASNPGNTELLEQILAVIFQRNSMAVLWKKILIAASQAPASLGMLVRSMAWTVPVLTGYDTTTAAGNFVRAIYDLLDPVEKSKVEDAILSISKDAPVDQDSELAEHLRNRLLGCIVDKDLVLDETRRIAKELIENDAIPSNTPMFSIESFSKAYTDEDILTEQGVSLETPEHKQILKLQNLVKEFASSHQNTSPTLSKANEILPVLLDLEGALHAHSDKIDSHIKDFAWGYLAQACERIASIESLDCKTELGKNIKRLLLQLASYPLPAPTAEQDEQFSKFQSWGSPAARIDAASGLILLARFQECFDDQLQKSIEMLSRDGVPAVRFQIAIRANALLKTAPDLMWSLLNYYATDEINDGVIKGSLHPLNRLAVAHPSEVVQLAQSIFHKSVDVAEVDSIAQSCLSILLGLHLWRDQHKAGQLINHLLDQKTTSISLKVHIATQIRDALSHFKNDAIRLRAINVLNKLVEDSVEEFTRIQERLSIQDPTNGDISHLKEIIHYADSIAMTIYFSSGAFAEKDTARPRGNILSLDEKRVFFEEISSAIKSLSQINYAGIIHHLVETLEALLPANPPDVFLLVNHVVKAGKTGGYQYETLAVDHIVQIVERYLAEYRLIFRENHECQQALLEVLDIFVEAGWPNARRLTYRLEEIYR
jgi:hypothetical protein